MLLPTVGAPVHKLGLAEIQVGRLALTSFSEEFLLLGGFALADLAGQGAGSRYERIMSAGCLPPRDAEHGGGEGERGDGEAEHGGDFGSPATAGQHPCGSGGQTSQTC